jgi:hypothetical protein
MNGIPMEVSFGTRQVMKRLSGDRFEKVIASKRRLKLGRCGKLTSLANHPVRRVVPHLQVP